MSSEPVEMRWELRRPTILGSRISRSVRCFAEIAAAVLSWRATAKTIGLSRAGNERLASTFSAVCRAVECFARPRLTMEQGLCLARHRSSKPQLRRRPY